LLALQLPAACSPRLSWSLLSPAAAGTTLVLAGVMGQRANRSGKVFPAGVVAILSALMSIGYARTLA